MKKLLISTTLAATLFTPQAFAQNADMGSYLGLGFGQSNIKLNSTDFSDLDTKDETGSAFKIYGGQQFNKNLAVEIGYANLGKATGTGTVTASVGFATVTAAASDSYKASAFTVAAVGLLPLENSGFSLLGMAGLSVNMIKDHYISTTQNFSLTKSKTDFYYGVGAKYAINKNFAVRVQYENFGKAGDQAQLTRSKLDLTSLNVEYKF